METPFTSLPIPIGKKIFFPVRERMALSVAAAVSTFTCWFILGTAAAAADDAGGMAAADSAAALSSGWAIR